MSNRFAGLAELKPKKVNRFAGLADLKPKPAEKKGLWDELINAAARGIARIGSGFEAVGASMMEAEAKLPRAKWMPKTTPEERKRLDAITASAVAEGRKRAKMLWELAKQPEIAAARDDLAGKGINLIGETLPYITATTLASIPTAGFGGFAVGSIVEGSSAYREALDAGVDENKAKKIGMGVGIVSGAIETVGGKGASALLNKATSKIRNKLAGRVAAFGVGTVVEALEEGAQEIAAITGETTYRNVNWRKAVGRTVSSMAGGAFLGGVFKGADISTRKITQIGQKTPVEMQEKAQITPTKPVEPTKPEIRPEVPIEAEKPLTKPAEKQPWEKSDLATAPNISESRIKAEKQVGGKWKLFYRGTSNEVFFGEEFKSQSEAKQFFKVQKSKAQEAIGKLEKPAKKPTMKPGFVDFTPIAEAGEAVKGKTIKAHKLVTRFTELESQVRKSLIETEEQERQIPKISAKEGVELFKDVSNKESLQTLLAIEKKQTKDLPAKLQKAVKSYERGIAESSKTLKDLGYSADWPNNVIRYLEGKLETAKGEQAELISKRIEDLSKLSYIHHTYKLEGALKKAVLMPRRITRRPGKLLGRKYDTLEQAIKAGKKPSHIAVSYAEMVAEARRAELHDQLISAINKNKELALPESKAPTEWVLLDERAFPSSKKQAAYIDKKNRAKIKTTRYRYHPAIAEAVEELAYTPSKNIADRFVRATYDKLNAVMKHVLFYNPVIMTKNDVFQAWRATGLGFVTKLPRAIKAVKTQNELYQEYRKAGLYNSVIDYTPSAKLLTEDMMNHILRTKGEKAAAFVGHYINPYNTVKDTKHLLDNITWGGDQIWRTAVAMDLTEGSFFTKPLKKLGIKSTFMERNKLSRFETIEMANDFMANYGKVPKKTRKWANRFFFTPTYRISMARMLAKMWASPKMFWPQLARHYAYKLFVWYILPGLIGAWVMGDWKTGRSEKGYKIVLKDGYGRERVYSLSDPLLEEAKLTQRPALQSFEYNISAALNLIVGLLREPKYKNKGDKYGHLFKLGTPLLRDLANMKAEDRTTAEKIMTELAIAYVYTRKTTDKSEDTAIKSFAKAISVWTDWKAQKEDVQKRVGIKTEKKTARRAKVY